MPKFSSDIGIIISKRNSGEADRVYKIYSHKSGKITVIAKGIRRLSSRKKSILELFSEVRFVLVSSVLLPVITEAALVRDYPLIRKSLKKISLAYYLTEVVEKITGEETSNPKLYELIKSYLEKINNGKKLKVIRIAFIKDILTVLGYLPREYPHNDYEKYLQSVIEKIILSQRVGKRLFA